MFEKGLKTLFNGLETARNGLNKAQNMFKKPNFDNKSQKQTKCGGKNGRTLQGV